MQEAVSLAAYLTDLVAALRQQPPLYQTEKEEVLYQKLIRRTQNLAERVRMIGAVDQPEEYVYYLERVSPTGNRIPFLEISAAPLDVAPWLKEKLFDKWPTVCASATLATVGPYPPKPRDIGSHFAYFKKRVGLEQHEVLERILPSTFDYRHNALLYVPRDLPEPSYENNQAAQDYMRAVAQRMRQLVSASRGRAFLLFASKRMLDQVYGEISAHIPYLLLHQGDLPRADDDRGVMAILDARLHTKGYGKCVLRALPPAPLVTRLEEVERFFSIH